MAVTRSQRRRDVSQTRLFDVLCLFLAAAMLVLSGARSFVGTAVLLHDHHDLGAHTHVGPAVMVLQEADHCHDEFHAHEAQPVTDDREVVCCPADRADVVFISEQSLLARHAPHALASAPSDTQPNPLSAAAFWSVAAPEVLALKGYAPCRRSDNGPRHLRALSASDRLVTTSRALLI